MLIKITSSYLISIGVLLLFSCKATTTVTQPAETKPVVTPQKEKVEEETTPKAVKEEPDTITGVFSIVMPFELRENFAPMTDLSMDEPRIAPSSLTALHFYEGCMMAIDSLRKLNRQITLKSYDAPVDSNGLRRLFQDDMLRNSRVVFALLSEQMNAYAAELADKYGINLILTASAENEYLRNNQHVALSTASTMNQCKLMAQEMSTIYSEANFILAWRNVRRENELAEAFRSVLKNNSAYVEVNLQDKGAAGLIQLLNRTNKNVVFIVSSDEAYISPLLAQLEEQQLGETVVAGLPTWQRFESFDFMAFQNLRIHVFDNIFIDYNNPAVVALRHQFIHHFYHDPLPMAYHGYDLVLAFGQSMTSARVNLDQWISSTNSPIYGLPLFIGVGDGMLENRSITLLRYSDYQLVPVR